MFRRGHLELHGVNFLGDHTYKHSRDLSPTPGLVGVAEIRGPGM